MYTTDYTKAEHDFIHQWHYGEVSNPVYLTMYKTLLEGSADCCRFLVGVKALMVAWNGAIIAAHLAGSLAGRAGPFDLVSYRDKGSPPKSNYAKYEELIERVSRFRK